MFGWIIFIGLITGFILGIYYLYNYWIKSQNNLDDQLKNFKKRLKTIPEITKNNYEYAYQNNTSFDNNDNKSKKQKKVKDHQVYAFHDIEPPDSQGINGDRKEVDNKKKTIENLEEFNSNKKVDKLKEEKESNIMIIDKIYCNSYNQDNNEDDKQDNNQAHRQDNNQDDKQDNKKEIDRLDDNVSDGFTSNIVDKDKTELNKPHINENMLVQKKGNNKNKGGTQMPDLQEVGSLELVKTPVVIGENVVQQMEVTDLPLDMTAIKIRDITATIRDLQTEVITDKVIIQGTIHKQIFYVGTDDIIHHQAEDISFSTFVDIPGAEAGMDVIIEPSVEHIVTKLIANGNILHQKVVSQFFVKVLSLQQLIVETGSGPLVKTERVIGENSEQTMLMNEVALSTAANKIVDITAEIRDLETEVIPDKVIIQGVVHKQIFYIGEDEVEHHQAEDIPFSEFIDIPGAEEGMNVQVHPDIEHIKRELCPDEITLNQEIVLDLFVKVTETVQINLVTGEDALVMLPEVIGENLKQILSETTIDLDQAAIKIKDITATFEDINAEVINDKVIVQGIIHKQIFFVGEDNVEHHQAENVPFSTFVEIMGARPGMDVDVIPTIAYIKPELSPSGAVLTQKVIGDIFVKVTEKIQFNVTEIGPYGT